MSNIGVGAGPTGPVLAGPLFGDLMKFIIDLFRNCVRALCVYYSRTTSKVLPTPLTKMEHSMCTQLISCSHQDKNQRLSRHHSSHSLGSPW